MNLCAVLKLQNFTAVSDDARLTLLQTFRASVQKY